MNLDSFVNMGKMHICFLEMLKTSGFINERNHNIRALFTSHIYYSIFIRIWLYTMVYRLYKWRGLDYIWNMDSFAISNMQKQPSTLDYKRWGEDRRMRVEGCFTVYAGVKRCVSSVPHDYICVFFGNWKPVNRFVLGYRIIFNLWNVEMWVQIISMQNFWLNGAIGIESQ